MSVTIPAVVTDVGRAKWPKILMGQVPFSGIAAFRVGEGGWIDPGTGAVRRMPDATLTNLDCIVNPSRYPVTGRAWAEFAVGAGDFTFVAPSSAKVRCFLDFGDFNDDGFGNFPEIWEIAIFDSDGDMLAYGTFPKQIKDPTKEIENFVSISF